MIIGQFIFKAFPLFITLILIILLVLLIPKFGVKVWNWVCKYINNFRV